MIGPYVFVLLGLFSFAAMGIIHKVGDRFQAQPLPIALSAVLVAGLISGARSLVTGSISFDSLPPGVLWIALPFGIATALALWMFQEGLRFGRIATSWLLINLSAGVPTVLSILLYHEVIGWKKELALLLIVASLLLLWWDRQCTGERNLSSANSIATEIL